MSKDTEASGGRQPRTTPREPTGRHRSKTVQSDSSDQLQRSQGTVVSAGVRLGIPARRYTTRSDRASAHSANAPAHATAALTSRNGIACSTLVTC